MASVGVKLLISVEGSLSIYYLQLTIYHFDKQESLFIFLRLAVILHGIGNQVLDVPDSGRIGGMRAQELRRSRALACCCHSLPEGDCLVRVVAAHRHKYQSQMVGLVLVYPAVRKQYADLRSYAVGLHKKVSRPNGPAFQRLR